MPNERKLTKSELKKREDIVMDMKKNKRELTKRYGKDAEAVMYGRATRLAKQKSESMNPDKIREMIKSSLKNPKKADLNKDGKLSSYEEKRGAAIEKSMKEMEMNDPILVKMRAAAAKDEKPDFGKEYGEAVQKAYNSSNLAKLNFLRKERSQLMRDMEQEAEPEGGPIADEYGAKLNRIDKAIAKLSGRKEMTYDQAIAENNSYVRVSEPKFIKDKNNPNFLYVNFKYDTGPGGASIAFGKETMSGQIRRLSSAEAMKQATSLAKDLEAKYNLEDIDVYDKENGVVQIFAVSDDFMDMDPNMLGENKILKQAKLSSAEYQKAKKLKDFNKDNYKWNPDESLYVKLNEAKRYSTYEIRMVNQIRRAKKDGEPMYNLPLATQNYYRKNKAEMDALVAKEIDLLNKMYDEYKPKDEIDESKFKPHMMYDPKTGKGYKADKKEDHERMDKMGYTHKKPSVKESISQTLAETIKLGEGIIEEELCPKGKAYIKRRKAAGEKSSAYLSGRAVKVCKGQMSGRKKRKSKKK